MKATLELDQAEVAHLLRGLAGIMKSVNSRIFRENRDFRAGRSFAGASTELLKEGVDLVRLTEKLVALDRQLAAEARRVRFKVRRV